jgi:prophage regulatory protein
MEQPVPPRPERLLAASAVLAMVPFCRAHLMRLAKRGEFPRPVKLGERRIAFRESEVRAWIDARTRAWTIDNEAEPPSRPLEN